jgi:hypothetical protein
MRMSRLSKACFDCGRFTEGVVFDFPVCPPCEAKLRLMTVSTVERHRFGKVDFEAEVQTKLGGLEQDYVRKKIKLLHILDVLRRM